MKLFARLYALEPIESGISESGEWERRTIVVETVGDERKLIALDCFGQRRVRELDRLEDGQLLEVTFTIEARQHELRWYNRVNLVNIQPYAKGGANG